MLTDVNLYSKSLKKLWADTFSDSEDYINLLFDCGYTPCECFSEVIDGEVVSVLYLLKGYILSDGMCYEGRYLYAAATAEKYRGRGIMSNLIKEAQEYVKEKGITFISLVPADEGLYEYYSRFGFEAKMKNYITVSDGVLVNKQDKKISHYLYNSERKKLRFPTFHFADSEWKYAVSCLELAECCFLENTDSSRYIADGMGMEILEFISSEENLIENIYELFKKTEPGTVITSPYDLSDFCNCRENRFGMIYFADEKIKEEITEDIYMNIALD